MNTNTNNNRRLLTTQQQQIVRLDERQTAITGLSESKNKMFIDTPIPPYKQGDSWNNNGVLRRCNNTKTEGQSYSINDWDIVAKTRQFIKALEKKVTNSIEYEQNEDKITIKYEIDDDATLTLKNTAESNVENTLIITNINGTKDLTLSLDISEISSAMSNISFPITIVLDKSAYINIVYTREMVAIITVSNGLITL